MNITKAKKIHFVGISGIGISGLARICLDMGKEVSGSDLTESIVTKGLKKAGAKIKIGAHKGRNLAKDTDLLVFSEAIPVDNIERNKAEKNNIEELSYPQALGQFTADKKLICVSGTHGKTTTTAMMARVLKKAGFDPTFIVGSYLPELEGNARLGQSNFVVIEADEYARAMLNYYPDYIVLNNLEKDHLDTYKNMEDIIRTFKKYIENLTLSGTLVINTDDKNVKKVAHNFKGNIISFGLKKGDYQAKNIKTSTKTTSFKIENTKISLKLPGTYNVFNALAAFSLASELGIDKKIIKKSLESFKGTWRRFEIIGQFAGGPVVSDYAHHPTEVENLIKAARQKYPQKRLVFVFQPHQHNRTKNLFNDFVRVLKKVDVLIVPEIFEVKGREKKKDQGVSSQDIVREVMAKKDQVYYAKNLKYTEKLIKKIIKKGDVIFIVGAGDIYKVGERLVD
ncbi:MAG: UDP-N-acetylmuramate--L-alanine ligase [Patescibacteria group bacterium]|nr:UDP-N-acetylmuramate--L-alanine ligase [Patescibacteria group bacterium]